MTICLGKCLTADTRVVDAESGAYLPIVDFAFGRKTLGMQNWRLQPVRVSAFLPQGKKPVYQLTTRAGLKIRATANHPFRQLHGWTQLGDLKPGDRIAVAREIPVFGKIPLPDWEATLLGLMIAAGQCKTPDDHPTFSTGNPVLTELLKDCIENGDLGEAPEDEHAARWLERYGLNVSAESRFVPQAIFMSPKETTRLFLRALFSVDGSVYESDADFFVEYDSASRRLIEDVHHLLLRFGVFSLTREKKTTIGADAYCIQITDREQIRLFAQEVGFWPESIKQLHLEQQILPAIMQASTGFQGHFDRLSQPALGVTKTAVTDAGMNLNSIGAKKNSAQFALETAGTDLSPLVNGPVWDMVADIQPAGEEEVFDLTIPNLHNFVANDMIVHNSTYARCGLIVNVTPLEPEWEGHITLEFSNTTPLPAKIYANEGVAQILFFESDEICETSYKDRAGKYQGQRGVTLPKS
ncbi:LAGLIDADG family homing endonuclease [Thiobaca trueperi]